MSQIKYDRIRQKYNVYKNRERVVYGFVLVSCFFSFSVVIHMKYLLDNRNMRHWKMNVIFSFFFIKQLIECTIEWMAWSECKMNKKFFLSLFALTSALFEWILTNLCEKPSFLSVVRGNLKEISTIIYYKVHTMMSCSFKCSISNKYKLNKWA